MDFFTQNLQVIIASTIVLAGLLLTLGLWRIFSPRLLSRRGQRLGVSEYCEIDRTRRLVLVRRDNVEHLLLIGAQQDLVVETAITPAAIAGSYAGAAGQPTPSFQPTHAQHSFSPAGASPLAPRQPAPLERKPAPLPSVREEPHI
ncbi:hypothetical protein [Aestuariivirga sp.]|jgi:flagellar protein FliO/FliZ|uniref:hypothetical protein n=1 Tax=Aestuariivirga sp. TaxID=2650926 RepID=UPI0037831B89